jgi:alkanesulfonate monooxygenase SsuD/methylene tetrahydromethanopterin reductase-like flavin-dependent oxidoreductase (luciferase family)
MKFAVNVPTSAGASEYSTLAFCDEISWEKQRDYARLVERLGFDGVAVPDHLMTGDGATTECLTTLAGLAGATDDVYLYPKTINNHLRHPPMLAKTAATVDNVSDGRLKLGMGAGWKDDEAKAYGYDWPGAPRRLREMEEAIVLLDRLWTEDEVDFDGEYVSVDGAVCKPHPRQDPRPPIMVGGGGEEFTLRIAAKHADSWNYWGPPHVMQHKLDVLKAHCETYGTDYDAIEKSWFARCIIRETEAEVEEILEAVPRFVPEENEEAIEEGEYLNLIGTPAQVRETLARYDDIGFNECVVEFVDFPDGEGPELFADEVLPEFQ